MLAEALLERNTDSEVLMDAMPALHRAAQVKKEYKTTFFLVLKTWLTFKEDRRREDAVSARGLLQFLVQAQKLQINDAEKKALEVITSNYRDFGPIEYLQGCD